MFKAVVLVLSLANGNPVTGFQTGAEFKSEADCKAAIDKMLPAIKAQLDEKVPGGVGFAAKCESVGLEIRWR